MGLSFRRVPAGSPAFSTLPVGQAASKGRFLPSGKGPAQAGCGGRVVARPVPSPAGCGPAGSARQHGQQHRDAPGRRTREGNTGRAAPRASPPGLRPVLRGPEPFSAQACCLGVQDGGGAGPRERGESQGIAQGQKPRRPGAGAAPGGVPVGTNGERRDNRPQRTADLGGCQSAVSARARRDRLPHQASRRSIPASWPHHGARGRRVPRVTRGRIAC